MFVFVVGGRLTGCVENLFCRDLLTPPAKSFAGSLIPDTGTVGRSERGANRGKSPMR